MSFKWNKCVLLFLYICKSWSFHCPWYTTHTHTRNNILLDDCRQVASWHIYYTSDFLRRGAIMHAMSVSHYFLCDSCIYIVPPSERKQEKNLISHPIFKTLAAFLLCIKINDFKGILWILRCIFFFFLFLSCIVAPHDHRVQGLGSRGRKYIKVHKFSAKLLFLCSAI